MILVLATCGLFAVSGLVSRRFGVMQNGLVLSVSIVLIVVQFAFARYL